MSGKNRNSLISSVSASDEKFKDHHAKHNCLGHWSVRMVHNMPYNLQSVGIIEVHDAPVVVCNECDASFLAPGFEELLVKSISQHLVVSDIYLSGEFLRFLRTDFELTQQEVATAIGLESISFYSKCESNKERLSSDKQVRVKLFFAYLLGVSKREDYRIINSTPRLPFGDDSQIKDAIRRQLLRAISYTDAIVKREFSVNEPVAV